MTPKRKLVWAVVTMIAAVTGVAVGFVIRPLSFFNGLLYMQMGAGGAHSKTVNVGGFNMHYYVTGPEGGKPVVLVHGLGGRCEDWHNLTPYLAQAGYRVYLPDLLGYGRSEKPADFSYSVVDESEIVVHFMDAMGLRQVDLGGWSMGGWIVQEVASRHPERINRLMLFDSAGIYEKPAWNTALFTPISPSELDQLDALLMPHPPTVPGFIAGDILRVLREDAWVIRRALDSMLTGKDATDNLLPQLKMPVLIVWGSEDRITPLSQGNRMHQLILHSQLEVIAGCGHLAPTQCADQIGPKLVDFLK